MGMGFDVLGLTELHMVQNKKLWKCSRWIASEDAEFDEQGACLDPASGVAILLSERFAKNVLAQGSVGSRIAWVRINGPVCPLFIVCIYVPHKFRQQPCATDVLSQLETLLSDCKKIKKNDCLIVMGDFNCEIQRNIEGVSGKWFMNKRPDDGHSKDLVHLMQAHDLFAVDSLFRPKRSSMFCKQKKRVCNATYLQKDKSLRPKKLDYFLVSNRWKSSVSNSKTDWAPSLHRFGKAFDHSLLRIDWRWRIRSEKRPPSKDFKAMNEEKWCALNNEIITQMNSAEGATYDIKDSELDKAPGVDAALNYFNNSISKAIEKCVPNKSKSASIKRRVSDKTRNLYEVRTRRFSAITAQGGKVSKSMRRRWNDKIKNANLSDYNDWVEKMTKSMEEAYARGDTEGIFEAVRRVSGKTKSFSAKSPSNEQGAPILDHESLADMWSEFLQGKFDKTKAENDRAYVDLGEQVEDDPLTKQAFLKAVTRLKSGKACGPDGIPGEVFKHCDAASTALFQLLVRMWELEYVPAELVRAAFVMLYKKGSAEDPKNYRCIGLLPHSYKVLSIIMLDRIVKECSDYLSDWQAGFRPQRGCRDNILLLRVMIDVILKQKKNVCLTFIDYSAAFDSVSHKFLDLSLAKAGASRKTRAMFRAIYAAASGVARVRGLNGKTIYSKRFEVRRGVIQGDIISPIFFILAMEQIFRQHDKSGDGVTLSNHLHIGVLGYADDASMASESVTMMSKRVTNISRGSKDDADMIINKKKTKTLQVMEQEKVAVSTVDEIKKTEAGYKHQCIFCPRRCKTARGLKIHMASCNFQHELTDEEFEINDINAVFGTLTHRWYRVCWVDHPGKDSWEPERSLSRQGCSAAIRHFWEKSSLNPSMGFIPDPDDVWRCYCCGKGFNTERGLDMHIRRVHPRRQWIGSTADKETRQQKRIKAQQKKLKVICEGRELANVWAFVYLGAKFSADGDHLTDVKARIAKAVKTSGQMRHIWASKSIPLALKLRVYIVGVCSQLTYGSEAWRLDEKTIRMLNGINSKLLHHITGKTIKEEASDDTRTFDLVRWIRARRAQWLGHILRMDKDRMVHKAVKIMHANRVPGDLLMDVPDYSWEGLIQLASGRDAWRELVQAIKTPRIKIDFTSSKTTAVHTRHSYNTRTRPSPMSATQPVMNHSTTSPITTTAAKNAAKYRARDTHNLFFSGRIKWKPKKKKAQPKPLTHKQKLEEYKQYCELHYGPDYFKYGIISTSLATNTTTTTTATITTTTTTTATTTSTTTATTPSTTTNTHTVPATPPPNTNTTIDNITTDNDNHNTHSSPSNTTTDNDNHNTPSTPSNKHNPQRMSPPPNNNPTTACTPTTTTARPKAIWTRFGRARHKHNTAATAQPVTHDKNTTTSLTPVNPHTSTPMKNSNLSAAWSPKILKHNDLAHKLSLSSSYTPTHPPCTDSTQPSIAWSPTLKILGHHHAHTSPQNSIAFTPPNANQLISYLDYLDDIREHGNPIFNLSQFE